MRLEAEVILIIQGIISDGAFELFSSRVIDFELNKIKDMKKDECRSLLSRYKK